MMTREEVVAKLQEVKQWAIGNAGAAEADCCVGVEEHEAVARECDEAADVIDEAIRLIEACLCADARLEARER